MQIVSRVLHTAFRVIVIPRMPDRHSAMYCLRCVRGQPIKTRFFKKFIALLTTYSNLSPSKYSPPLLIHRSQRFSSSGTRPGTCFAGWRESPVSNFLLSPLPSEIDDVLVRISTSGKRKSPKGPNVESRAAVGQQSSNASSKIHE